ncbi:peptidoglycan-binding domain-containing protein [Catenulispora rubra]|uniref:peptidoglycan-binding domain-containing protein n=1 Tax=Catenulispora rubra TaxID=280293 RepID=UPI001E2C082E|nr:peptidoglycan-binding domain-containing protein [Catenulispora rubra]
MLDTLGYNAGATDGIWGPNTRNAVLAFQRAHEFDLGRPDGIVGAYTGDELLDVWAQTGRSNGRGGYCDGLRLRRPSELLLGAGTGVGCGLLVGQGRELVRTVLEEWLRRGRRLSSLIRLDLEDGGPAVAVVFAKALHADSDVPVAARRRAETLDADHPDLHDGAGRDRNTALARRL